MQPVKIFVTGGCGFIGSHLCEKLVERGFTVVAFDRYNSENHRGWLEESEYRDDMEIILGDIRDYDSVFRGMNSCTVVVHMAALIGIPYSYVSPLAYLRTNVEGTYNVLETARNQEIDQILITSTSETYGSAQFVPIHEKHPLVGQSPYSASKIAADQLAISYFRSFGLPVKIIRPFNTYGPRQSARAVIPTIISQVLGGMAKIKLGNISPTRDLTYVIDTCDAILAIYEADDLVGEVTNIGTGTEISIEKLAGTIGKLMNVPMNIIGEESRKRPIGSEVNRLVCDNRKLLSHTNWNQKYQLDSGLEKTIKWFEEREQKGVEKGRLYNV